MVKRIKASWEPGFVKGHYPVEASFFTVEYFFDMTVAAIRVRKGIKSLNSECMIQQLAFFISRMNFSKALRTRSHSHHFGDSAVHTSNSKILNSRLHSLPGVWKIEETNNHKRTES